MEAFYSHSALLLHFSGFSRQRGSGFGTFAASAERVALPLVKMIFLPAVKSIGKDFLNQSLPEAVEVATIEKPQSRQPDQLFDKP